MANGAVFNIFAKLVEWTIGYLIMKDLFRTKTYQEGLGSENVIGLSNILLIPKAVLHLTQMSC